MFHSFAVFTHFSVVVAVEDIEVIMMVVVLILVMVVVERSAVVMVGV